MNRTRTRRWHFVPSVQVTEGSVRPFAQNWLRDESACVCGSVTTVELICDYMLHPVCYSEKAFFLIEKRRQYIFEIDSSVSKLQARELVEKAFQVNVVKIQSLRLPRKNRRVGQYQGYLPIRKRIIFRLAKNQSIPIL